MANKPKKRKWSSIRWIGILPLLLFVCLFLGNLQSFQTARRLNRQLTASQCTAMAEELALRIALLIQERSKNLALLTNLWREAPARRHRETFLKYAKDLIDTTHAFDLILYIDDVNIMMVTAPSVNQIPLTGLDIRSRPARE